MGASANDQLREFVSRLRVSDNMQPGRDRSLRLRRRLESEPAPLVRRNPRKPGEFSAAVVAPSRAFFGIDLSRLTIMPRT